MNNKDNKKFLLLSLIIVVCLITMAFFVGLKVGTKVNCVNAFDYTDVMDDDAYGEKIYVIGHKNPDTDTVISAITYAALKNKLGVNCVPVISGKLNNETKFILKYFDVAEPEVLSDATGKNFILVDHASYEQAIDGMENANVIEVIDHHKWGNINTDSPIYIKDMAIGSTATIIYTSYIENKIPFDKTTAGLLLSAILSDTNNLTSSTTTDADKIVCMNLKNIAKIDNIDNFYEEMRKCAESYDGMTDDEIFYSDYKEYEMNGMKVGIACVNSSFGYEEDMCNKMKEVMQRIYINQDMQHLYVLVGDYHNNQSILLNYGEGSDVITKNAFEKFLDSKGNYVIRPFASRKKDVVPALEKVYDDIKDKNIEKE